MNEKIEHENLTLQDYYQSIRRSKQAKASKILNFYVVLSSLNFIPIFCDLSSSRCGNVFTDPLELYFNICFPIGFLAFLWNTKLAVQLKDWRVFSINLLKMLFPFFFVIKNYLLISSMNIEPGLSIWWLNFLYDKN